ncbi:uncharacterized protein LOC123319119 [Coccinella septempunctata]|uniref:uncharacterized protein LOC123319119 n=1 Tax=Coccinella septempunctata TaxID=41139 RepID=UPI001D090C29|nr:uncharacterized protein LOC123319119 [Coccinella septempunctata]
MVSTCRLFISLVVFCVVTAAESTGKPLRCHSCFASMSTDACAAGGNTRSSGICDSPEDICISLSWREEHLITSNILFLRGCGPKWVCEESYAEEKRPLLSCSVCSHDLCNVEPLFP